MEPKKQYSVLCLLIKMDRNKALKYMKLAQTQAQLFSKDPSVKVGAIFLRPESLEILTMGYNGMPRKIDEKKAERWEKPIKYKWVEHAERNAIYNASRHGTPLEGAIAIITLFPCCSCARALIQSGIQTVVTFEPDYNHHRWGEDFTLSFEMFQEVGIKIILLTPDEV